MPIVLIILHVFGDAGWKSCRDGSVNADGMIMLMKKRVRPNKSAKLNNKGVSLVELIVAMTILAFAAVVIYEGFVMAAKTNSKSRVQHKATSLAQSVLEGLKAETLDEILYQVSYPSYVDGDGATVVNFDILPASMLKNSVAASVSAGDVYMAGNVNEKEKGYNRTADGKYEFMLKDVKMENTLFDVAVLMDSSPYITGESSNRGQEYNSQKMIQVPTMDSNYDAVIANSKEYDADAWSQVASIIGADYVKSRAKRVIEVTIEDTPLISGDKVSKVSATYTYYYDSVTLYTATDVVFDNSLSPEYALRNLFLFFRPSYGYIKDEIIINNPDDKELNIYMVKQQVVENAVELIGKENTYTANITVKGSAAATAASGLKVKTNLGTNIGSGTDAPMQATYTYYADSTVVATGSTAKTMLEVNNLTNSEEKDKLMDVYVNVYHNGELKASLTGSIRN